MKYYLCLDEVLIEEVVELSEEKHPFFVAAQFHPEFTSRPELPNPLFLGLLQACKTVITSEKK